MNQGRVTVDYLNNCDSIASDHQTKIYTRNLNLPVLNEFKIKILQTEGLILS